jgi:chitin synthase
MVWYQKFEYAVSHWLQKAAENMIGCVLCSPGCFSLFRGASLMDDNVMRKYTALPTEAYQHVQYDQGTSFVRHIMVRFMMLNTTVNNISVIL